MTLHSVVLFIHIMGTVGLFVGFGFEWLILSSLKRTRDTAEANAWTAHLPMTFGILISSLVLLLVSGVRLASRPSLLSQGWIEATLAGLVIIMPFAAVGRNRVRAIRRGVSEGRTASEVRRQSGDIILWTSLGLTTATAAGMVLLMTAKPNLGASSVLLGIWMVLGLSNMLCLRKEMNYCDATAVRRTGTDCWKSARFLKSGRDKPAWATKIKQYW